MSKPTPPRYLSTLLWRTATIIGGNTDGYVRSIKRDYDSLGRLTTITSYSNSDGTGTVRNQVVQHYTDYATVDTDWQSHSGAAVTSGGSQSPNVQYGFDATASSRLLRVSSTVCRTTSSTC